MSEAERLPQNLQERLARFQQLQSMLQSLVAQKERVDIELSETERALKSLGEAPPDRKIYRSVGSILVEKSRDEVIKEMNERKELLEMRSKALEKQESKARERLTGLQQTLQKELSLQPGPPP